MDPYLEYLPTYRVVVCRQCSVAVWLNALFSHLKSDTHELTSLRIRRVIQDFASRNLNLCVPENLQIPTVAVRSLPSLPVYLDGQRCILSPNECAYICRSDGVLRRHWKLKHNRTLGQVIGGSGAVKNGRLAERLQLAVRRPVRCQRLFTARHGSHFFEVYIDFNPTTQPARKISAKEGMLSALKQLEEAQEHAGNVLIATSSLKEISPWLQLTRWLGYLDGHSLGDIAKLAWKPTPGAEDDLVHICGSIDRLVDAATEAIQQDGVNPFDQMRINSFLCVFFRKRSNRMVERSDETGARLGANQTIYWTFGPRTFTSHRKSLVQQTESFDLWSFCVSVTRYQWPGSYRCFRRHSAGFQHSRDLQHRPGAHPRGNQKPQSHWVARIAIADWMRSSEQLTYAKIIRANGIRTLRMLGSAEERGFRSEFGLR